MKESEEEGARGRDIVSPLPNEFLLNCKTFEIEVDFNQFYVLPLNIIKNLPRQMLDKKTTAVVAAIELFDILDHIH